LYPDLHKNWFIQIQSTNLILWNRVRQKTGIPQKKSLKTDGRKRKVLPKRRILRRFTVTRAVACGLRNGPLKSGRSKQVEIIVVVVRTQVATPFVSDVLSIVGFCSSEIKELPPWL
jgi:hypothetical protein